MLSGILRAMTRLPPLLTPATLLLSLTACMGPKATSVGSQEAPATIIPASELNTEGCVRKRIPGTGRVELVCPQQP